MTDPEVLKARKAVNQHKELNAGTVEKLSKYDPISKSWIFEKVKIDPRAKEFQRPESTKRKKDKPKKKNLTPVNGTPRPAQKQPPKPKKPRMARVTTYTPKINTKQKDALQLAQSGKDAREIADILNITTSTVYRYLRKEGFELPKYQHEPNARYLEIKAMMEKGMTSREIKQATGIKHKVYYYINEIKRKENEHNGTIQQTRFRRPRNS